MHTQPARHFRPTSGIPQVAYHTRITGGLLVVNHKWVATSGPDLFFYWLTSFLQPLELCSRTTCGIPNIVLPRYNIIGPFSASG